MAVTITGSQVQFPSNGNMEGFYTGSSATNTSYPIGSYLWITSNLTGTAALVINNNALSYPKNQTGASYVFGVDIVASRAGWSLLSGTWVTRGTANACGYIGQVMVQRIA